jgi:hypothetical protein
VGAWTNEMGFTGWSPLWPFEVESCCGTPSGNAGLAFVIVGDISPSDDYTGDPSSQLRHSQRAVDLAAERLKDYGYDVTSIGIAYPNQPATASELRAVAENPDVKAIALFTHGLPRNKVITYGEHYLMADGYLVSDKEISQWRQNGTPLTDISLYLCNAGADPDILEDWNVAPDARVILAPSLTQPIIWNAVEERKQCPDKGYKVSRCPEGLLSGETQWYTYLTERDFSGQSAEQLYGFISGFVHTAIFPSGHIDYFEEDVGIHFDCDYLLEPDTLTIWANKYAQTPADTVPPEYACANAYYFGLHGSKVSGSVKIHYDEDYLKTLGLKSEANIVVWLYDEIKQNHVELAGALIDTFNNTITFEVHDFEQSLVMVSIKDGLTSDPGLSENWPSIQVYPNPAGSHAVITYELTNPSYVRVLLYRTNGRLKRTLFNEFMMAGSHEIYWDCQDEDGQRLPSGVYIICVKIAGNVYTKTVVLIQ